MLLSRIAELQSDLYESLDREESLKQTIATIKKLEAREHPVVGLEALNDTPSAISDRKAYVARVAIFFKEVMDPQLKKMISLQHAELAKFGQPERNADFYRASINFAWLLIEWGEDCFREHMGYVEEARMEEEE